MDTVDNQGSNSGDRRRNARNPRAGGSSARGRGRPPGDGRPQGVDHGAVTGGGVPGDQGSLLDGEKAGLRGADLARDALRAARESSARKAEERAEEQRPKLRVVSGKGRRRRWSSAGPDDRDPQPLGRLASRISMDRGWSSRLTDATVLGRWPQLVGSDIADHCTPMSLRDGELTLQAESTAWATQLRTLQRQLLTRLAAAVGPDVVRRIRVVGPSGPSWRHGPRHVRGRGPRDTYG
ncbi:DciA family protein [Pseudonocardia phyllosphaerae]|uniref:DciA family protein n=1 Tax=Pseudonocardia phyllosphaerae TaxID=3390502 RepID=UPI00397DD5AE